MKTRYMPTGAICIFLSSMQPVSATSIIYDVSYIFGNTWEYTYTVNNLSLIHISEPTRRRDSSRMPSSG